EGSVIDWSEEIESLENGARRVLGHIVWLLKEAERVSQRMFCKYCKRHKKQNVFGSTGSINFGRKSSVKEHAFSDQHIDTIKLDTAGETIDKESGQLTVVGSINFVAKVLLKNIQHIDAIKLDTAEETIDKEQRTNHIIG
ncbi:9173_t:CDS:2, partial [Gigaspora rosea]